MQRQSVITILAILLAVALAPGKAQADTHYVSTNGLHLWPYTSWPTAATNIASAIDASSGSDHVVVSNGIYVIRQQIAMTNEITVESLNGAENTLVDGSATTRCFFVNHPNAVISGLTIQNGKTSGDGGGVYIANGGTLQNCVITNNESSNRGGGIACFSNGVIRNCYVVNNRAPKTPDGKAGGIQIWYSGLVDGCIIRDNVAGEDAGGIQCDYGGIIRNCLIERNRTIGGNASGGGLRFRYGGRGENCVIRNNRSTNGGGVWMREGGTLQNCLVVSNVASIFAGGIGMLETGLVENCTILGNTADYGGGITIRYSPGRDVVRNSLIIQNVASQEGGGVYYDSVGPSVYGMLENCTIADNVAPHGAGIFELAGGHGRAQNCIVAFNKNDNCYVPSGVVAFSCTRPDPGGTGNTTNDPGFANKQARDYRLTYGSTCIDAGTNLTTVTNDIGGVGRPLDGNNDGTNTSDIGAYEFVNPDADSDHDGQSDSHEISAGTDLINSSSFLRLLSITLDVTNRQPLIAWATVSGKSYWLQICTNLLAARWTNATPLPVVETNETPEGTETVLVHEDLTNSQVFYRILLNE